MSYTAGPNEADPLTEETASLIASDKVEGTAIYGTDRQRLGSVYNFMVNKRTGQVAYAVLSFGGFLGMGQHFHPIPWRDLTYDTALGGYVINLSKQQLEGAPAYADGENPDWADPSFGRRIDEYYATMIP